MDDQSVAPRSIQRELTRWIFIVTLSISAVAGITSGLMAFFEARDVQDEVLRQIAQLISGAEDSSDDWWDYRYQDEKIIVMSVQDTGSELGKISHLSDGFDTINSHGVSWRIYIITKQDNRRFAVAQQTELRNEIALANATSAVLPICVLALVLLVLMRWLIYARMRPIVQLSQTVDNQTATNLKPLSTQKIPTEILPFVDAINRLLLRTKDTIAQQHRFIADASHELRTPITALSLLAENLENAKSQAQQNERMGLLRTGLDRLNNLVNQLLNLARLQKAQSDCAENIRLDEVVKDAMVLLHPLAMRKNIDLGIINTTDVLAQNINQGLKQLVENAITNAINYTPDHGQIDVSVDVEANTAVLTITDTGPGIAEEDIDKVFTPFYRAQENTELGSGLGLAICNEIAKQHNGNITLKNRESGGLIFTYRQPIPTQSTNKSGSELR